MDDAEKIRSQIGGIVDWLDKLKDIELDESLQSEQSTHIVIERADDDASPKKQSDILKNAPQKNHGFFVVPKVVG